MSTETKTIGQRIEAAADKYVKRDREHHSTLGLLINSHLIRAAFIAGSYVNRNREGAAQKWEVVEFDDYGSRAWEIKCNGKNVGVGCFKNKLMADELVAAHNSALAAPQPTWHEWRMLLQDGRHRALCFNCGYPELVGSDDCRNCGTNFDSKRIEIAAPQPSAETSPSAETPTTMEQPDAETGRAIAVKSGQNLHRWLLDLIRGTDAYCPDEMEFIEHQLELLDALKRAPLISSREPQRVDAGEQEKQSVPKLPTEER